jgi:hypothetical protein
MSHLKKVLIPIVVLSVLAFSFELLAQKSKDKKKKGDDTEHHMDIKDACKREESLARIKTDMTPFRFDKVTTTKIQYKAYDKVWSVAIPLFHTTQYKFIFNTEGLPTGVDIKISDKPLQMSTAKVLHQSSEKHFTYETPTDFEGNRIYVSIKVPADPEYHNGVRNKGCVIMGSGYQNMEF